MFEFYGNFSFLGKLIFLFGVLVVICSIFYQCTYCKYVPLKLQWDNSAYRTNLAQQVPLEPFQEPSTMSRIQRLRNMKRQNRSSATRMSLAERLKSNSKQMPKSKLSSLAQKKKKSSSSFNTKKQKKAKLILFYADWCRHCTNFKPEWKKLVSRLKGIVDTVSVNGDLSPETLSKYNVDKFPTIIYDDGVNATEYNGEMSAEGLKQFVVTNYNNGSTSKNLVY